MHGKIFCGGQREARCPHTETEMRKYVGKRCLNEIRQTRQDFDACRAVSLSGGQVGCDQVNRNASCSIVTPYFRIS